MTYRIEIHDASSWEKNPKRWTPIYWNIRAENVHFCLKAYEAEYEVRAVPEAKTIYRCK